LTSLTESLSLLSSPDIRDLLDLVYDAVVLVGVDQGLVEDTFEFLLAEFINFSPSVSLLLGSGFELLVASVGVKMCI
jgi:hypothetical protein